MSILIATLGASWQVIPEIVALIRPDACPLYQRHPNQQQLDALRRQCGVLESPCTALWVITSSSPKTTAGVQAIQSWAALLDQHLPITFFVAEGTDTVTSEQELHALQELVFRVVLKASEQDAVVCSLAGGRKTMSADLQHAASALCWAAFCWHRLLPCLDTPIPDLSCKLSTQKSFMAGRMKWCRLKP